MIYKLNLWLRSAKVATCPFTSRTWCLTERATGTTSASFAASATVPWSILNIMTSKENFFVTFNLRLKIKAKSNSNEAVDVYDYDCVADLKQISQSFSSLKILNLPSGKIFSHRSHPKHVSCQNLPRKV